MVLSYGEADLCICFEPTVFIHEHNIWRLEGVLVREKNLTMVESFMEFCVFGSLNGEMPVVDVVWQGGCYEIAQLFFGKLFNLSHYSLLTDVSWFHSCQIS